MHSASRHGAVILRTLFVVLVLACLAMFLAVVSRSAHADGRIELVAVPARVVDEVPPPGRAGNFERLRWSLRNRYGKTIGSGVFNCRWHMRQERLCSGELRLPLGKLTVMGSSSTRTLGTWAVTGGTGRYARAGGELRFTAIGFTKLAVTIVI